jgi:phosphoribosyl 1,2-cyclic phosphodiesterase/HAMP domain-containing protein
MHIKCWGARGSIPVSGGEYNKYGGDTTCIEIRSQNGDIVVIDAGTGIRRLGHLLKEEKSKNINILLTHTHWDHVQGFPFFSPIYIPGTHINLYGCPFSQRSVKDMLKPLLMSPFFPVSFDAIKASVDYISIEKESFSIGSLTITPIYMSHPGMGLGFKITEGNLSFVFLTDNELKLKHPGGLEFKQYVNFCKDVDLLIHDAMFTNEEYKLTRGWGHSTYADALELSLEAGIKHIGFFHHYEARPDNGLDQNLEDCNEDLQKKGAHIQCFGTQQEMEIALQPNQSIQITAPSPSKDREPFNEEDLQKVLVQAKNEVSQLKSTINALRLEMEKIQAGKEDSVQEAKSVLTNEIGQLKDTIRVQREFMTRDTISFKEKIQQEKQAMQAESNQLKETISVLRQKLEKHNGK